MFYFYNYLSRDSDFEAQKPKLSIQQRNLKKASRKIVSSDSDLSALNPNTTGFILKLKSTLDLDRFRGLNISWKLELLKIRHFQNESVLFLVDS